MESNADRLYTSIGCMKKGEKRKWIFSVKKWAKNFEDICLGIDGIPHQIPIDSTGLSELSICRKNSKPNYGFKSIGLLYALIIVRQYTDPYLCYSGGRNSFNVRSLSLWDLRYQWSQRTASLRLFGAKHYIPHNFPHQMNWLSICAEIKALLVQCKTCIP